MQGAPHAYLDDIGYALKDLGGHFRLGVGGLEAQFEDLVARVDEEVLAETVLGNGKVLRSSILQGWSLDGGRE